MDKEVCTWEKLFASFHCFGERCITLCRNMSVALSVFGSMVRRDGCKCYVAKRWTVLAFFCVDNHKLERDFPEFPYVYDSGLELAKWIKVKDFEDLYMVPDAV